MTGTADDGDGLPACAAADCGRTAAFWLYRPPAEAWSPYCARHLRDVHPSVEIRAWLESGYGKPAELGRPDAPPGDPEGGRATGFRSLVDEALGWNESGSPDR